MSRISSHRIGFAPFAFLVTYLARERAALAQHPNRDCALRPSLPLYMPTDMLFFIQSLKPNFDPKYS